MSSKVWVPRDLSEIKPGSFQKSLGLKKRDVTAAETDQYYRFIKRLTKPRERDVELQRLMTGVDYIPRAKTEERAVYSTTDYAVLQNLKNCKDVADVKNEIRTRVKRELDEMKCGMKPTSARKVYGWTELLEERESKSAQFPVQPTTISQPNHDTDRLLDRIYHRDIPEKGRLHNINGYWAISRPGPQIYRDKWGLKILNNLAPEEAIVRPPKAQQMEYHYQWPYTDPDAGHSLQACVKRD